MMMSNKTLDYYMSLPYKMVVIPDEEEGGYTVFFPDLPGCVTCVEDMKEVIELSNDAKREWFKAALDSGISIKKPHEDYSGQLRLRMPKSLHRILSLKAAEEGISLNQLVVYELGKSVANY